MSPRAGIILIADGRVALIERHRPGVHYYVFPGGGVDEGEEIADAARREAHEELGVEVELIGDSVARMRTPREHRYWRARIVGGTFGKGHGSEYFGVSPWKGTYKAAWIPLEDLAGVRVIPRVLAGFVVEAERSGWPVHEVNLIEWAWLEHGPQQRSADPFAGEVVGVVPATVEDIPAWLRLAAEVEDLFGAPMSTDAEFRATLERNIARGTAFCIRENWGGPCVPLAGALLWRPSADEIGWLAVASPWRRRGIGRALIEHAVSLANGPVRVTTFSADVLGGEPARAFYIAHGFAPLGPDSTPEPAREVFELRVSWQNREDT